MPFLFYGMWGTTEHTKEPGEPPPPPPGQLTLTMQPALTSNLWGHWIQPEEGQTADWRMMVEATGSPRTSPQQRGASWGTGSKRMQGELPRPFPGPAGWAGSDCLKKRNVESGLAWAPWCCDSNTADRSRRCSWGRPGARTRPKGRGSYTGAGPAA